MIKKAANRIWVSAILLLLPLLYFLPGKVILAPGDGWTQNLGVRYLIGESIRQGILPLWNPYIFGGMPLLATVYPGALYPPNWLFAFLSPVWAINIVVITTFQLALIGTYLFARSVKLSKLGAVVAAITFSFGGFMIAHIGHTSRIAAAAWLPFVLLAIEKLFQENKWRWVCLGALFIFLQFIAGEPQMLFFTALVSGCYVLFSLLIRQQQIVRWKFILSGVVMALCGSLFSCLLLLPARELQAQGERANMAYEHFSAFSLPPKQVLAFIFPYFFGGAAQPPYFQAPWGSSFWGEASVNVSAGYVGLLGLMLAVIAIVSAQKRSLVWLWVFIAAASLILAFGGYLPFHINEYLHKVPGYNVFRGSYRHLLEFTFAMAMLAGTGLTRLAELEVKKKWRTLWIGVGTVGLLVLFTAIFYCQFAEKLVTTAIRLKEFGHLSNAEAFIPLSVFCLSAIALLIFVRWQNRGVAAIVLVIVLLDVASFGWFYEWRNPEIKEMSSRLPDAPTVQFLKSKESDLNSFRIVSSGTTPFKENYEFLDYPNNSIMRGLQSVNGYDVLRLSRVSSLAGDLDEEGKVIDTSAFAAEHHGFDLFNVKYLLREKPHATNLAATVDIQGIKFNELPLGLKNSPGSHFEMKVAKATATEIAIISSLANSGDLKDGTPLLTIKLYGSNGKVIERQLLAGRDSSEWAYDRSDVKASIKHSRAPVIESWEVAGYQGHRYLARLNFERAEIERVEIDYAASTAECFLMKASLFDATTKNSSPISGVDMPSQRWQMIFNEGPVEIYQNKKAMPRAWFVKNLLVQSEADTLKAIKEGKLNNGESFDPADTALLEVEDFGGRPYSLPPIGEATNPATKIVKYTPNRILIDTSNSADSFLVLSEIYYRGWDARIDGKKAPVYRVNHTFRGVALPSGRHSVEYVYHAPSLRAGANFSLLGLLILSVGSFFAGRAKRVGKILVASDNVPMKSAPIVAPPIQPALKLQNLRRIFLLTIPFLRKIITPQNLLIILLTGFGILILRNAAYAVGGSDATGYINAARAILQNKIVEPIAPLQLLDLPVGFNNIFLPLAHLPGPEPGTMTAFYPIGMSLQMLLAGIVAGWKTGPFLISPLAALFSVLLIYLVGQELRLTRWYAFAGAVMLAICPVFIYIGLLPMSDVNATMWALLTIFAALRTRQNNYWALLVGAAFGMAFLVRPTNIFLLLPVFCCFPLKPKPLMLFVLGGTPLAVIFFSFNWVAYGNFLQTGYGTIGLYKSIIANSFLLNFKHYVSWVAMGLSPLVLLGWVAVAGDRKAHWRDRALLISWFGTFFLFYCCYEPFFDWWFSRFLLPGIPALILGTLLVTKHTIEYAADKVSMNHTRFSWAVVAALITIVAWFAIGTIQKQLILEIGKGQYAFSRTCRIIDEQLPKQSLIVSMEMSGAIKYYTGRSILRWDAVHLDQWQTLQRRAAEKEFRWYALLMEHEVVEAQKRVPGNWSKLGDYAPISLWQIEPER